MENREAQAIECQDEKQEELKFYTTKDVARILGCSLPTARDVMMRYVFPLIRVGKNMKVSSKALEEWSMKRHI